MITFPGRAARLTLLAVLAASLSACATDDQQSAGERRHTGALAEPAPDALEPMEAYAKLGYRLHWRGFPTISDGSRIGFYDEYGPVFNVMDAGGMLTVLDSDSGRTRWSGALAGIESEFVGTLLVGSNVVAVSDTTVYVLDAATGDLRDKQKLGDVATSAPVMFGSVIIAGSGNGHILGHDTRLGLRVWTNATRGAIDTRPAAIGDTLVGVTSSSGSVLILDIQSGSRIGENRMYAGAGAPLAASDTTLYVSSLDHSLYAFAADNASIAWRHRSPAPIRDAPAYHDGAVYCTIPGAGMTRFNALNGDVEWANERIGGRVVKVNPRDGTLVVWQRPVALLVDAQTGEILERIGLFRTMDLYAPSLDGPTLYAVSVDDEVEKYQPRR